MSFSGDLKGIQLPDVFQNIHANRLSGTIHVRSRSGERFVYFREGMVGGFSLGTNKGMPVGDHLVARGYVDKDAFALALRKKTKSKKALRTVLQEQGHLDEATFSAAIGELIEEHVYELLRLKEATYEFSEGDPPPRVFDTEQKSANLALDPNAILMESARRLDEWERIGRVVLSDNDLFVALEGWDLTEDGSPPDELWLDVGEYLDGRTEIRVVVASLPYSRFEVLKVVSDMVMAGLARPLSATEVEGMAQDALDAGNSGEAVTLLTNALMLERSNHELRTRLAGVFEDLGRYDEAAAELAVLGHQKEQAGDGDEALEFYARAAQLCPSDLKLHERRTDLLRAASRNDEFVEATLQFADLLVETGLEERARNSLRAAVEAKPFDQEAVLLERLAVLEADLGGAEAAAKIWLDLAQRRPKKDSEGRLRCLREALALRPDDDALQQRVHDLETGQAQLRRAAQRRFVTWAAGLMVVLGFSTMGVVELVAYRGLVQGLEGNLDDITRSRPSAAWAELDDVREQYGWTMAGRSASRLLPRMIELEIVFLEECLREGSHAQAIAGLRRLQGRVQRGDVRRRLDALLERAELEERAHQLFIRVNDQPRPDLKAQEQLGALANPQHLDFLLARLEHPGTLPRTRQCLLRALLGMNSARSLQAAARVYVTSRDPSVSSLARKVLQRAAGHRDLGRERAWAPVYTELDREHEDPTTRRRAAEALRLLRGEG